MALSNADLRQEVRQSTESTIEYRFNIDGIATTPDTSVTVDVDDPSGASIVSADSGTNSADILQYTISAANVATINENYRVKWTVVDDSVTYYRYSFFDVVRHPLEVPITKNDLVAVYPDVDNWEHTADTDLQDMIMAAHRDLRNKLWNKQMRPYLIIDKTQLVTPYIYYTLSLFMRSVVVSPEDKYHVLAREYMQMFERAWSEALNTMVYDLDDTLTLSDDERVGMDQPLILRG